MSEVKSMRVLIVDDEEVLRDVLEVVLRREGFDVVLASSGEEALNVLKHLRSWLVVDRTVTFSEADYEAAVRMRLDATMLPKPFQLSALTSRELQLESPWKRFTVRSPQQLPAPVESREPRQAER